MTHEPITIEILENRIAPAAVVTVDLTNGLLTLSGDDGDASVILTAIDATHLAVTTGTDTTFSYKGDPGLSSLILDVPVKALDATFGSGSDSLSLHGADFKGDISIHLGDGATNAVTLDSVTAKGLVVEGGVGTDSVTTIGSGLALKGSASFDVKGGDNAVALGGMNLIVGGDFVYTGSTGKDSVVLSSKVAIKGKLEIDLQGAEGTVAALGASIAVGKTFEISAEEALTGEAVNVALFAPAITIGGDLQITTGAGNDVIANLTLGGKTSIKGNVAIDAGDGNDSATLFLYGGKSKGVVIDGGDGDNSMIIALAGASTGNIALTGGSGTDMAVAAIIGGKAGAISMDLGAGGNTGATILVSGGAKSFSYEGGADSDMVAFGALNAKLAAGLTASVGEGAATFFALGLGGGVGGTVKLESSSTAADSIQVMLGGVQAKFGAIDITTGDGTAMVALQPDLGGGGGLPLPIPPIAGVPVMPSLSGLLQGFTVTGASKITGGAGNTTVQIGGAGVTFANSLTLDLGAGVDSLVGPAAGAVEGVKISKLNFLGGEGDDAINLIGQGSLGAVVIDMGEGNGQVNFSGASRPLTFSSLTYKSTGLAAETDSLHISKAKILGKLDASFGAGNSLFETNDSLFGGTVNVTTGAGADIVNLDVALSPLGTTFTKAVTFNLGDDDDAFTVGADATYSFITTKSTLKVDGGAGANSKTFDESKSVLAKAPTYLGFV